MKCIDARPLLDPMCDGALAPKDSALVLDHLKTCEECEHEWQGLEELHARFQDAKATTQVPVGLMDKISNRLKDEEAVGHRRAFSILPMAACFLVVGVVLVVWLSIRQQTHTVAQVDPAAAGALIEDVLPGTMLTPVADRNELAKDVGFDLQYVRLPGWKIDRSSVIKSENSHAGTPIARFDFVRGSRSGAQRMTCYQAPAGSIRAWGTDAGVKEVQGKQVFLGHHGKFQFALWSQNGRDYLFVTLLPLPELEAIVGGA